MEVEIMFNDLCEEKQKELLDAFGADRSKDLNWDTIPVTSIPIEDEGRYIKKDCIICKALLKLGVPEKDIIKYHNGELSILDFKLNQEKIMKILREGK